MRLIAGLTAVALSGLAAAASQPQSADAYVFQASWQRSPETPSIPKEVARHILLHRTSTQRYGGELRDIPKSIDTETAVDLIAKFGKRPTPLFTPSTETGASQLVVIFEGVSTEQSARLRGRFGEHAAFTISDPPSATANNHLMSLFRDLGTASPKQCELAAVINPFETGCWTGPSSVVKYDLRKSPMTLDSFLDNVPRLEKFVSDGDLEVLLLALPESSRTSKVNHWSAAAGASDLRRRRDAETVLSDQEAAGITTANPAVGSAANAAPGGSRNRAKAIPQCFASFNACMTQTNNCSSHGECANKYGTGRNSSTATSSASTSDSNAGSAANCFVCVCKASSVQHGEGERKKGRRTVHWGGNMCQKEDVSVTFWLIAGFTVTMVGAVTFAIGLLFSVGEETLPGVIGAGVSRSK